jgi:hypothetical protein
MEKLRKMLVISVMMITVLSMCVIVAPQAGAAAPAGSLIKMNGLSSVYYLAADGKRYVFPNESTYFSWYGDFSGVVTIPQTELESYNLGANVTVRPGTKLVKITTNPNVYAVTAGGKLVKVPSETVASTLWGTNWAKRVIDVADSFFTNYTIDSGEVSATAYPSGSLVKMSTGADVYYIASDGKAQKITSEAAFLANRFNWDNIVTAASTFVLPATGADITGVIATLTDTSSGAGGSIGAGTGVTVALSSTTAASGTLIQGQAIANMASFNFTASNDGDVKLTTIKLKRLGVSADATLANVYLYNGATRLTDSASVSSGYMTFVNSSGIITVPKGQTITITVKSDIEGSASGQTVGVALNAAADITTDGASVSGSFPMNGNLMSIATATLATVDFSNSVTPAGDGTPTVQNDFVMWQDTVTIGQRAVNVEGLTFRQIGSAQTADLGNFKLYIDGVQVGSTIATVDANGFVVFDLSAAPKFVDTGARTFKLIGDIKNGSTRTIRMSIEQAGDVMAVDTQYGANVLSKYNGGTFQAVRSVAQTIASGNLTLVKASASTSGNVILAASGVTLAKYTLKATGEAVKIDKIRAAFTPDLLGSTAAGYITQLRNGKLMANGVQIGSTASLKSTASTAGYTEYTVNYVVTPGTDVTLDLIADIYDDDGTNNATSTHTLIGRIVYPGALTGNARGQVSLSNIDFPDSNKDANQLTITTGSLTLAKTSSYGDQTMVTPQTNYKLGSYVLTGSSNEDVNLNTFTLGINRYGTLALSNIRNVYIKYGTLSTQSKTTVSGSNSFSLNYVLAKNASVNVDVYADLDTVADGGASTTLLASGNTAQSGQTANSNNNVATIGQNIVVGVGSLKTSVDASAPTTGLVVGPATSQDAAAFKFAATNDSFTITEVVATTTTTGATAIVNAMLKDGTTVVSTQPVSGTTITFSGLSIPVAANASKVLTVSYQLASIGTGAGSTGANIQTTLVTYKANNSSGVQKTQADELTTFVQRFAYPLYVYKSVPTITTIALPATSLTTTGTWVIARIKVAASTNPLAWKQIQFTVTPSGVSLSNFKLYDENSNEVTGSVSSSTMTISGVNTFTALNEQPVATEHTYSLKADVAGVDSTGDSITTSIARLTTTFAASQAYSAGIGSFVWSDVSANNHDTTASVDWTGDFLVKNLTTDSQGITRN